jgi:hypothetical protein
MLHEMRERDRMSLEHELLELEKRFWTGDTEFYRRHLNDECLVAFTQMAGVMSKDAIAATVKEGQRWRELEVTDASMLQLAEDVALLTYRASAMRASGEPYAALVSSGYVRHNSDWRLAFHQQTPMISQ